MASKDKTPPRIAAPRLYLATSEVGDPADLVHALPGLIASADIAAVLVRFADADERTIIQRGKALAPAIQNANAAMLIADRFELVARMGADGAHLRDLAALNEALPVLKPDRIAGVAGLESRHDAMLAGETADYVMFGEPPVQGPRPSTEAIAERLAWWAEVFEVPCVGCAASRDEALAFAQTGAEFLLLGEFVWKDPRGPKAALMDVAGAIGQNRAVRTAVKD
jgi:thiamine-phosphate pyrophosphorylase